MERHESSKLADVGSIPTRGTSMKKVHLLWIGKTGGNALRYGLTRTPDYKVPQGNFDFHSYGHDTTLRDIPVGEGVIFFIRDPLSRFISGFYSRKRKGLPLIRKNKKFYDWTDQEQEAFLVFETPNQLALALSHQEKIALDAMKNIHHVNTSYWDWFSNEFYFLSRLPDIFFVGTQENLPHDFERLKKKLNFNLPPLPNKDHIRSHGNQYEKNKLDTLLNEEAIRTLKKWYSREYDFIALVEKTCSDL